MKTFLHIIRTGIGAKDIVWVLLFSQIICYGIDSSGQTSPILKNNNFEKARYDSLSAEIKKADYATQCAQNAAEAFADSAFLPELLFQLSEWEVQKEKLHFELAMMKYDLKFKLYETGKLKIEPIEPVITYDKPLQINHRLLKQYPDLSFINRVLYRTGICLFEIGEKDSSKKIFQKLLAEYPDSCYVAEVLFRLGECYFEASDYEQAIQTYHQILEAWQSPFFPMALYKIGWCQYRLNNYSGAISTFYYLLNDIKFIENLNPEWLGKSQVQLTDEIMDYITISFSDFGGAEALISFTNSLGESEVVPCLLHKLGEVYLKRDFYQDAIDALNLVLKNFSTYQRLPEIFALFFRCYEKMGNMEQAYTLHDQLISYCGQKSNWAVQNHNSASLKLFKLTLTEIDYKIATPLINTADSLFANKNYKEGAEKYLYFLKRFSKDKRADHASYCLAECYYNSSNFNHAADVYKAVVLTFPQSELREDAAYNFIVCHDQVLKEKNISIEDSTVSLIKNKDAKNLVSACYDFLKWVPESNKEPEIKLKLAEIFYRKKFYSLGEKYAKSALVSITKYHRGKEHKIKALNLLAQINFKQDKFRSSELLTNLLIKENPDSTELIERSKKILASASFKIGEQLKSSGKIEQAAIKFEETAWKASDPKIAEASLFEAAVQYELAKQFNRAAVNFEQFHQKYPQSERSKEAIYRAALSREKLTQFQLAARNYMLLNQITPNTPEGSAALYNAGLAYEKANDWASMVETFKHYVEKYPDDRANLLEVLFKIGYAYEQKNMIQSANTEYQKLLTQYNQMKSNSESVDDYCAAQAAFRLAEIKCQQFKTIKLTPPFQANLKRKQAAFNELLKFYVEVTHFNIAEWTTAAFYRLGLAYEEFCQDILDSPAPPNLTGTDLEAYWTSINQQWILPLQREALKYYQTNDKLAAEHSLNNEWIEKTRARVLCLNQKLATESNMISHHEQVKEASGTVTPKANQTQQKL